MQAIAPIGKRFFNCFRAGTCRTWATPTLLGQTFVKNINRLPFCFDTNDVCIHWLVMIYLYQPIPAVHPGSGRSGSQVKERGPVHLGEDECPNFNLNARLFKRLNCSTGLPGGRRQVARSSVPRKLLSFLASPKMCKMINGMHLRLEHLRQRRRPSVPGAFCAQG